MRAFISHSSHDKPAVEALACALRARGVDAWLDRWEIHPDSDIVTAIHAGLAAADAGVVVFSARSARQGTRVLQRRASATAAAG
jgi:hypothetical protein